MKITLSSLLRVALVLYEQNNLWLVNRYLMKFDLNKASDKSSVTHRVLFE